MSSNFGPPKPFNFSSVSITGNYTLAANTYNVIYGDNGAPANITLPDLTTVLDGFPVYVINTSSFTLTVLLSNGVTVLATVLAGQMLMIISNKQGVSSWKIALGPVSSTGLVQGSGATTNNAVALWSGTTGQVLKNSTVLVDGSNNVTGASSITLATTGGTATALNYYEEFPLTGNTFTGAFTVGQSCVLAITRLGRDVRVLVPAVSATGAAAVATSTVAVPARFLPPTASAGGAGYVTGPLFVQNGATTPTNGQAAGQWTLNTTTGIMVIGVTGATGPAAFGAANNNGWLMFSAGWSI
jgi:hypothetical protein